MVGPGARQKVGDEGAGEGNPLLVPGLGVEAGDAALVPVVVRGEAALGAVGGAAGVGPPGREVVAVALAHGALGEPLGQVGGTVGEPVALGASGARRRRDALEGVVFGLRLPARVAGAAVLLAARERCAGLVVWEVGLAGVREERDDGGDAFGGARLAGRDHDAELHEVVVDAPGTGLDDVDILPADRVLNLAPRFAAGELGEDALALRQAEDVGDVVRELGVGVAAQQNDVADHG